MANLLMQYIIVPLVVLIVKSVVSIYTVISWPVYYLVQKPWKRLEIARNCGAHLVQKGKLSDAVPVELIGLEYLEYERFVDFPYHPLKDSSTMTDALCKTLKMFPLDQPSQGYREILEEEIQYDHSGKPKMVDGKVLRKYKLSAYKWKTLGEVSELCFSTGRGLIAAGMQQEDKVALYAETGINFFTSILGMGMYGGVAVTLFHTLNNEGLIHGLNETETKFILTTFELMDRVASFIDQCPSIEHVIYFEGPKKPQVTLPPRIKVWTHSEILNMGRSDPYKDMEMRPLDPHLPAMIMYTSGTTGMPKGVVATGAQLKESALAVGQVVRDVIPTGPSHIYIAYLPQAHILELSLEMFLFLGNVRLGYASPFTLNDSAPGLAHGEICDLKLLKPTIFTTVPLVLDRMQKEIYLKLSQRTPFSKDIFNYLIGYKSYWIERGYKTPIINRLLCSSIRREFGNRVQYLVVASAPLAPRLQSLIKNALEVTLIQGYGTTETSGGVMCMDFADLSYGRTGAPLNGVRVRLIDWPQGGYSIGDKPHPRGELLLGGKMITKEYYKLEDKNKESFFDEDGSHWFVSGDIAEVFPDGTFKIIDRKKDLVKLANGEFISLGKVEAILKSNNFVDDICIVATSLLNALVALVVPNHRAIHELATKQFSYTKESTRKEICTNIELTKFVHKAIVETGLEQGLHQIELPSLITLIHEDWTPDNNMLTAAMKLKRANIQTRHAAEIDRMFAILKRSPHKRDHV